MHVKIYYHRLIHLKFGQPFLSKITWTSRNMSGDQGGGVGVDIPFKVQIVTNINFLLTFSYTIKCIV